MTLSDWIRFEHRRKSVAGASDTSKTGTLYKKSDGNIHADNRKGADTVQKKNKYGAKKVHFGGETYDSKHEFQRGQQLQSLLQSGKISNLQRQVKFELLPAQRDENGKCIERACHYVADYVYEQDGKTIVEDCKSPATRTAEYVVKRKLMLLKYGIRVVET